MITLMKSLLYPVSNAEFANGRGEGVYKQTKSDYVLCEWPLILNYRIIIEIGMIYKI